MAVDQTAAKRGHNHIALIVDIDQARAVFATEREDAENVAAFTEDLTAYGADPTAVAEACIDMNPDFIERIALRSASGGS